MKATLKLYLAYEKWLHCDNDVSDVRNTKYAVSELVDMLKHNFPRNKKQGWKLVKMHALAKMPRYVEMYGNASSFYGGIGEHNLITFVKKPGRNTQRRPASFTPQLAMRNFETSCFEKAYDVVCDDIPLLQSNITSENDASSSDEEGVSKIWKSATGEYTLTFGELPHQGQCSINVRWKKRVKNQLGKTINMIFALDVSNSVVKHGYSDSFDITGYTEFRGQSSKRLGFKPVIYRACEDFRGSEWYDWSMVKFEIEGGIVETCPCLILGFFRYSDKGGIPTDYLLQENIEEDIIREKTVDRNLYAVVHATTKHYNFSDLLKKFVLDIYLDKNLDRSLFVVDVVNLSDPLYVFRDYGGTDKSKYFAVLPHILWGDYFTNKIRETTIKNINK